jgi:hypothetical protein
VAPLRSDSTKLARLFARQCMAIPRSDTLRTPNPDTCVRQVHNHITTMKYGLSPTLTVGEQY